MKALAFRISMPINFPLPFNSAVMLGLSSMLPPSAHQKKPDGEHRLSQNMPASFYL
jgi:hypothetical protein